MAILTIIAATLLIRPVVPPNSLQIGQLFVGMPFGLLVGLMMDNFSEMAILIETQPVFFRQASYVGAHSGMPVNEGQASNQRPSERYHQQLQTVCSQTARAHFSGCTAASVCKVAHASAC